MDRQDDADIHERLVKLETKQDAANEALREVQEALRILQKEITHYKGMVGGALFIISALIAAFQIIKEWLFNK